jgi:DNA-binding CsgD family transcriptional regulator
LKQAQKLLKETDMTDVKDNQELTDKQRDVLDLLLDHMTSKEIALHLDISPHTVDQRIGIARRKLNANSRSQLVQKYRALASDDVGGITEQFAPASGTQPSGGIYGKPVYQDSYIVNDGSPALKTWSGGAENVRPVQGQTGAQSRFSSEPSDDLRVVPEIFDGRFGTYARIGTILSMAAMILILMLGGLAMFSELSALLAP